MPDTACIYLQQQSCAGGTWEQRWSRGQCPPRSPGKPNSSFQVLQLPRTPRDYEDSQQNRPLTEIPPIPPPRPVPSSSPRPAFLPMGSKWKHWVRILQNLWESRGTGGRERGRKKQRKASQVWTWHPTGEGRRGGGVWWMCPGTSSAALMPRDPALSTWGSYSPCGNIFHLLHCSAWKDRYCVMSVQPNNQSLPSVVKEKASIMFWIDFTEIWEHNLNKSYTHG